jgi:hypothetical protein
MSEHSDETEGDVYLGMRVSILEEPYDPSGCLKRFSAHFYGDQDHDEHDEMVGLLCGWIGWRVMGDDIADVADAISADSAYIGSVAATLLEEDESGELVEDVVLVDRMWIEPPFRGRGLLARMVDQFVAGLRLDVNGCYIVTEPEPQQPSGGPYPHGPMHDKAMQGLLRSLHDAGFAQWKDGRAQWRYVER